MVATASSTRFAAPAPLSWVIAAIVALGCLLATPTDASAITTSPGSVVRIDARTYLAVPAGAVPRGARIVVTHVGRSPAPGLVGRPFRVRLIGAQQLRKRARLVYRFPAGLPATRFRIGVKRNGTWRMHPMRTSVKGRTAAAWTWLYGGGIGAPARSGQGKLDLDWAAGVFAEAGQQVGELLGARAGRPTCPTPAPEWTAGVTFLIDAREPVFSCSMSDPGDPSKLEVRLVNNRSYGMWVSFDGARPTWSWDSPEADVLGLLVQHGRLQFPHDDELLLMPQAELHLGFTDPGVEFSVRTRPARELVVATAAAGVLARWADERTTLIYTPLFVCDVLSPPDGPKQLVAATFECAKASIDAIAAHKMAFLDNATEAYVGARTAHWNDRFKFFSKLFKAMELLNMSFQGFDLAEIGLGSSWRTITVKHAFVPPDTGPGTGGPGTGPTPRLPVTAYDNYGSGAVGRAMCRGNPGVAVSMPGGTATQTFTVPAGVAVLDTAKVQIDPDSRVTAHANLWVDGALRASSAAAAAGDTTFAFAPTTVTAGDQVTLAVGFTATFGKIITVYTTGAPGGRFTAANSCPDGAPNVDTTATGLRAVISGWNQP